MADHAFASTSAVSPPRRKFFASISAKLRGLVALMALSSLLLSGFAGYAVFKAEKESTVHAAGQTAQALASVVERELAVRSALLTGLAASPSLRRGELSVFWDEAKLVERDPVDVIVLTDADGKDRLSTASPPNEQQLGPTRFAAAGGANKNVSDLLPAAERQGAAFGVRVPVEVNGQPMYLGLYSNVSQLQSLFKEQPLPDGWLGTVMDSRGYVVARTVDAQRRIGQRISEYTRTAVATARQGVVKTNNLDGEPVFGVFSKAAGSDWLVIVSLSRSRLAQGAWLAFGVTLAMSLGFAFLTLSVARRITHSVLSPLRELSKQATLLGEGHSVPECSTGIPEIDPVQSALARASRERQEADQRLRS